MSSHSPWDIPPPPGTEEDPRSSGATANKSHDYARIIDRIDPYLKNPQRLEYDRKSRNNRDRSRSRSYDDKHRTKSDDRYHRSSSRSRRKKSKSKRGRSRSRSRSRSRNRHSGRRDREKRSRHSSHSRHSKYSRSRSNSRSRSSKSHRKSRSPRRSSDQFGNDKDIQPEEWPKKIEEEEEEEEEDEDESESPPKDNAFKNDGSFLEMFKKMQEEKKAQEEAKKAEEEKQKLLPAFGKRKGGRVLKTGMVVKNKPQDGEESAQDPWSLYMNEVKKYREACCDDDSKTRPLVKMEELKTAPFDPRFPSTNQTRYCYTSYVDYHRCRKVRGEDYAPCEYFHKVYRSICPNSWIEKWDNQREEGRFSGNI